MGHYKKTQIKVKKMKKKLLGGGTKKIKEKKLKV